MCNCDCVRFCLKRPSLICLFHFSKRYVSNSTLFLPLSLFISLYFSLCVCVSLSISLYFSLYFSLSISIARLFHDSLHHSVTLLSILFLYTLILYWLTVWCLGETNKLEFFCLIIYFDKSSIKCEWIVFWYS